jgi:hypothetical protein
VLASHFFISLLASALGFLEKASMRNPLMWKIAAVLVLAIVAVNVLLGVNLLPSPAEASERGTFAPLMITWLMILVCVGSGLALAGFLLAAKRSR